MKPAPTPNILLTGASGYIGGRLLSILEKKGNAVRCLTRRPQFLEPRISGHTEVFQGDVLDSESIVGAMEGIETAFYMIHSMGSTGDFEEQDRIAANNFGREAERAGVKRIIYLGGLMNEEEELSAHMRSRLEVADCLRSFNVQVIEFRASIVIGSGSLSFELIRALVERLPLMITPRWVDVIAQPISISDVLSYLSSAIALETEENLVIEIGGSDQISYGGLMKEYARQRGLKRGMIPVPFLTPYLSSLWLGLVTPVYARIGRKLVDSIKHPTVVRSEDAFTLFPDIKPLSASEAIQYALINEDQQFAETRWSDALSSSGLSPDWGGVRFSNRLVDSRTMATPASPNQAFDPIQRIGGDTGWYYGNWLWNLRGFLDLLLGGVGVRRGRRHPVNLTVGDTLDFWRVEAIEPGHILRLSAEMKLPGRAWLEFEVLPNEFGGSTVRQTAIYDPVGLWGLAYWYGIYPLHQFVFAGMLQGIVEAGKNAPAPEGEPIEAGVY